jgi:trigger factor
MSNQETVVSALERRIDMSVPLADIEKDVEARLKQMARTVKMPGFRPGKVPFRMVAQSYGQQARSEAIGAAVERVLGEQIRTLGLRVAGYPSIEPKDGTGTEALEFTAVFEVYPEVSIADVSAQEVERPLLEVGDAEVDQTLEVLRKQRTTFAAVERAAQDGDRVVVDFTGRKDGVEFEGGKASDFAFVIGAGQMLKDFETAVLGLNRRRQQDFRHDLPG